MGTIVDVNVTADDSFRKTSKTSRHASSCNESIGEFIKQTKKMSKITKPKTFVGKDVKERTFVCVVCFCNQKHVDLLSDDMILIFASFTFGF